MFLHRKESVNFNKKPTIKLNTIQTEDDIYGHKIAQEKLGLTKLQML